MLQVTLTCDPDALAITSPPSADSNPPRGCQTTAAAQCFIKAFIPDVSPLGSLGGGGCKEAPR